MVEEPSQRLDANQGKGAEVVEQYMQISDLTKHNKNPRKNNIMGVLY